MRQGFAVALHLRDYDIECLMILGVVFLGVLGLQGFAVALHLRDYGI